MSDTARMHCSVCGSEDYACEGDHPLTYASQFLQRVHTLEESRLALAICATADRIDSGEDGTLILTRGCAVGVRAQVSSGAAVTDLVAARGHTAPGFRLDFLFAAEVDRIHFDGSRAWFSQWFDDWGTLVWSERGNYYLPFLAVEVDDPGHWRDAAKAVSDRARDRLLLSIGIATIRVSNDEVRSNPTSVAEEIADVAFSFGHVHDAVSETAHYAYQAGLAKRDIEPSKDDETCPPESSLQ